MTVDRQRRRDWCGRQSCRGVVSRVSCVYCVCFQGKGSMDAGTAWRFLSFFARTVMSNLGRTGGHRWAGGQWEKKGRVDVREGVREGEGCVSFLASKPASQPAQPALVSSSSSLSQWQSLGENESIVM